MRREGEFGIHEDGLPGPEEISDEETRLKSKKGIHKGKFYTPEEIPSHDPDPLELLITKEEQEKNKKEWEEEHEDEKHEDEKHEDTDNQWSGYDPDIAKELKKEMENQYPETEKVLKKPAFSSRESESMRPGWKKDSKITSREQAQGKRGKEPKQKHKSQNHKTIRKDIKTFFD